MRVKHTVLTSGQVSNTLNFNGRLKISTPQLIYFYSLDFALVNSTLFVQVPTPSRPTSTVSPSFSQSCGFLPIPTPWGVPVKIKSPGKRVVPWLKKAIVLATPKIISLVLLFCTSLPLTLVQIFRLWGSLITLLLTIPGPYGAQPSNPFPRPHCPPPRNNCHSRWETSLPMAYPRTWSRALDSGTSEQAFPMIATSSHS